MGWFQRWKEKREKDNVTRVIISQDVRNILHEIRELRRILVELYNERASVLMKIEVEKEANRVQNNKIRRNC